ncbi:MAG: hypothetical protein WCK51_01420 [Armatimonadota bacterium]
MAKRQKVQWLLWGISFLGLGLGVEGVFKVWALPTPLAFLKLVAAVTFIVSCGSFAFEAFHFRRGLRSNFYTGSPCAFLALATIQRLLPRVPYQDVIDYEQGLNIFMCLGSAGVALFVALLPEHRFKTSNSTDGFDPSSKVESSPITRRE